MTTDASGSRPAELASSTGGRTPGTPSLGELRAWRERLRTIVEAVSDAIAIVDFSGAVAYVNGPGCELLGIDPRAIVGRPLTALYAKRRVLDAHGVTVAGEQLPGSGLLRGETPGEVAIRLVDPDSRREWSAVVRTTPLLDERRRVIATVHVFRDVTSEQRFSDRLRLLARAGSALGAAVANDGPFDGVVRLPVPAIADACLLDAIEGQRAVRIAAAGHLAWPAFGPEALGDECATPSSAAPIDAGGFCVHDPTEDDLRSSVGGALGARLRDKGVRSLVTVPVMSAASLLGRLTMLSLHRTFDEGDFALGQSLAHMAADAMIARRRYESEQRARLVSSRLQEVTAALSRAITLEDVAQESCRSGIDTMAATSGALWRRQADGSLALAGAVGTRAELVAEFSLVHGPDEGPPMCVATTGEPIWVESHDALCAEDRARFGRALASAPSVSFAAMPVSGAQGVMGVLVFAHAGEHRFDRDERAFYVAVSQLCAQALDRARLLDEARAAAEAARQASRAKDEFLAMLGHELRNPLAPIVTALQLMKLQGGRAFHKERAILDRQVRHLGRLVDDLLDVARITAGRVDLERQPTDVSTIVRQAIETAMPIIEEKRHRLNVQLPEPPLLVHGDPVRLAQVVSNLLTNAAKYTEPGGHLDVLVEAAGEHAALVVRDDGIGIDASLLPRVFDLFTQGAQPLDRRAGGLGLGLAIVKSLVELHGGTVEARSDGPGRGSEFCVRLPLLGPHDATGLRLTTAADAPAASSRGHVLIVDDNEDAAELLDMSLSSFGFRTERVHDGACALDRLARIRPDAAVLDIGLPGMDGLELARRIRAKPELQGIRLLALTGYSQPSDRARTREAGFDAHLVKPVDIHELDQALSRLLERR